MVLPRFSPWSTTSAPLVKMEYPGGAHSKTLIIFLPGIDDLAADFERRGIIDDMRSQGLTVDALAVDAHFGYYAGEVILERITEDVVAWAHTAGYEEIWLAGVSLGGFGAALYAAHHSAQINGLLLFAPYLGTDSLINEITDAGGTRRWEPGNILQGDYQRALWAWFKNPVRADNRPLKIYLGYGTGDKFARANKLLSETLNQDQVFAIAGGHDWKTWKKIWLVFLERWKRE